MGSDSRQYTEKKAGAFLHPSLTTSAIDSQYILFKVGQESITEVVGDAKILRFLFSVHCLILQLKVVAEIGGARFGVF